MPTSDVSPGVPVIADVIAGRSLGRSLFGNSSPVSLAMRRALPDFLCHSGITVSEHKTDPAWRDPLSMGWQAHRRLLILRLRWHSSSRALSRRR